MRTVIEAGAERDFAVHFENVGQVPTGASLAAVADLAAAADASLCFDVGHAHMETDEETVAAFVRGAGDRIDYLHVHDVRARGDSHVPVGAGEIDFARLGGLLREIGFDGRAAVEVFTDDAAHMLDSADRFAAAVDGGTRRQSTRSTPTPPGSPRAAFRRAGTLPRPRVRRGGTARGMSPGGSPRSPRRAR